MLRVANHLPIRRYGDIFATHKRLIERAEILVLPGEDFAAIAPLDGRVWDTPLRKPVVSGLSHLGT